MMSADDQYALDTFANANPALWALVERRQAEAVERAMAEPQSGCRLDPSVRTCPTCEASR